IDNASSIAINASSNQTLHALTTSVQGGAAAVGASFTRIAIGNDAAMDTYAGIGSNVRIGQGSGSVGDITIQARSRIAAKLDTFAMAGGVLGATFNFAYADLTPDVVARIGAGTRINSTGAIRVLAGTDHDARTDVFGLSVGGLAAGLSLARSNLDSSATAEAGGQITADSVTINAGQNVDPLTLQAIHQAAGGAIRGAFATAEAPAVGLATANASLATATSTADAIAAIGAGAVFNVAGAVSVRASGISQSLAVGRALSISLVGMGLLNSRAVASGSSKSSVGAGARVSAGTLAVQSDGIDHADSDNDATSLSGLGSVGASFSKSEVAPTVTADIGQGATVSVGGTLTLRANSSTDGDAKAHRTGASFGVDFGMITGTSLVTPTVRALVDSSSANPTVVDAGTIDIQAQHGSPVTVSDGTLSSVDTDSGVLATSAPHGLVTGNRILDSTNDNAPIGGLVADRSYGVIVFGDTTIRLGAPFLGSDVDDAFDTIRFATQHGFSTGDQLQYGHFSGDGGTDVGGLTNGQSYYVRVIDPLTIKLGSTLAQVTQSLKSFAPSAVDNDANAITLNSHGFADGQAVTYRAPRTATFQGYVVDDVADKIAIGPAPNGNDFATGERVTYTVTGVDGRSPVALGGLGNGGSYYVYRVDPDTIKLSAAPIKNDGTDVFVNLTRSEGADQSMHRLVRFGERAITGLEDGHTYYVERIDANHFSLSASAGGTVVDIANTGVSGTQYIGVEGIDLSGSGVIGQQYLAYRLSGSLVGTQRLVGAGGLSSSPDQFGIDGVSYANGAGPSFALLIAGVGATARVDVQPTLLAAIGEGAQLTATGHVSIEGVSHGNAEGHAGVTAGAFLAGIGFSAVRLNLDLDSQARIGDSSSIEAGDGIKVRVENRHVAEGEADAGGGAAGVAVTGAKSVAEALPVTLVDIGDNASLHAVRNIEISAVMGALGTMKADSSAYAFLGSGGAAESFWALGNASNNFNSTPRETKVNLGANSRMRSEDSLSIRALVSEVKVASNTDAAAASAIYSDPDAEARTLITSIALVNAEGGAQAIGVNDLTVVAAHADISNYARSRAEGGSAFGAPDSDSYAINRLTARIITEAGSAFGSKDVDISADYYAPFSLKSKQEAPGFSLNVFDDRGDAHMENSYARHITMNGDLILLSAPTPKLMVSAAGQITQAEGLSATDHGDRIVVDDLSNDGNAGKARLSTNVMAISLNGVPTPYGGVIDGDQGRVIVRHTWETVELVNYSGKDLWVNAIDPVDRSGRAKVQIDVDTNDYRFDIAHEYAPTVVTIANLGTTGTPAIVLNGLIDNPIGTTNIANIRGDVFTTNTGKVRTNRATVEAAGRIGITPTLAFASYSLDRFDLELVQSEGRNTRLDTTSGGAQALRVRGLDRDPAAGLFQLQLGVLDAGGDLDLRILPTLVQLSIANAPAGYLVDVSEYAPTLDNVYGDGDPDAQPIVRSTAAYASHYKPDGGGPAFSVPVGVFGTGSTAADTHVTAVLLKAGGNLDVVADFQSTRIDLSANTNLIGLGRIDVTTNGNIALVETEGDLRAGSIVSTLNNVTLTAAAGIVDADGDAAADVSGNRLVLMALAGSIGSFLNDLEIDSAHAAAGDVLAVATGDVFVSELTGSLVVDQVEAGSGDVRLSTHDTTAAGEDIVVGAGEEVSALSGSVTLQAGDSLLLQGSVLALANLFFQVDYRNADRGFGTSAASVRSTTLKGSRLFLRGDEDDDLLDADGVEIPVLAWGLGGNDTIYGGTLDDQLYGGEGADFISGGAGDDLIVASGGVGDVLLGGDGDDILYGSPDGADIDPNWDDGIRVGDSIDGGAGDDLIHGLGGADDIRGGTGNDFIDAGAGNDRVQGDTGADVIYGHLGDDLIYGHAIDPSGDDAAADLLYGEWVNDTIVGGAGNDLIHGGFGNDTLSGNGGDDILRADFGLDTLSGGAGDDLLHGSDDGANVIHGGDGRDRVWGYGGNDSLYGDGGADIVEGGAGDDLIEGGAGADLLVGGDGNDTLYGHSQPGIDDDAAVDVLFGDLGGGATLLAGRDRLVGNGGNDLLYGEGEDDDISGSAGFVQAEASGGSGNLIDFGSLGDGAGFVIGPVATPAPTLIPVDYTMARAASDLPQGSVQRGRWGNLAGAASEDGLSGSGGLSTDPAVAMGPDGSSYAAWTDTRSGNPQVLVARLVGGAWTELAGSAGGNALGAGVAPGVNAAFAPSIAIDASGAPVVAWTADHDGGQSDIRVARFDSGSGQWEALGGSLGSGGISGTGTAGAVKLVMTSSGPVAVWLDGSAGAQRIYARSYSSGGGWVTVGAGSASGNGLAGGTFAADVRDVAVASDGSRIALAWTQLDASGLRQVYLREFSAGVWSALSGSASGTGVSGLAEAAAAGSISHGAQPSVAYFGGQLFVAWQAFSDQAATIAVMRFDASVARTPTLVDLFGQSGVPSSPQLSAGGGALRLAWQRQPLADMPTELLALRYDALGGHFTQELPGEASSGGLSRTGARAMQLALATDSSGRSVVLWQDAAGGEPEVYARGMSATVARTFTATGANAIQAILNANDLGAGDVIVVTGTVTGDVLIAAQDAGVMIYGAPGAWIAGNVSVAADSVLLQRLQISGSVSVQDDVNGFTLTESSAAGVSLGAGSNAQITASTLGGTVLLNGAVQGALIDHNTINASTAIRVQAVAGVAASNLTISANTINAGSTASRSMRRRRGASATTTSARRPPGWRSRRRSTA
ncbi:MAG: hypothetical protein IT340_19470, partial [Chloroflexi bacterium]|nr:hypothetical protein [Chloroflexota bacterium]